MMMMRMLCVCVRRQQRKKYQKPQNERWNEKKEKRKSSHIFILYKKLLYLKTSNICFFIFFFVVRLLSVLNFYLVSYDRCFLFLFHSSFCRLLWFSRYFVGGCRNKSNERGTWQETVLNDWKKKKSEKCLKCKLCSLFSVDLSLENEQYAVAKQKTKNETVNTIDNKIILNHINWWWLFRPCIVHGVEGDGTINDVIYRTK